MTITALTSYFWMCYFGKLAEEFAVLFVSLRLSAHFPEYWHIFPTALLFISSKFIISCSCSFLCVIVNSCSDLNVQQMGMRQNILNICGFVATHAVLSIWGNLKNKTLVQSPGDQGSHTRTQILRSVLEPTQFPIVMVCQDRHWICHSELIIPGTLMQQPFWGRTKWACRAGNVVEEKFLLEYLHNF